MKRANVRMCHMVSGNNAYARIQLHVYADSEWQTQLDFVVQV